MRFLVILGCAIGATLVALVDPTPKPPMDTVDGVARCVQKYWLGKPIEKWTDAEGDPVCLSIMNKARETNR
jgi:hypothetical protein